MNTKKALKELQEVATKFQEHFEELLRSYRKLEDSKRGLDILFDRIQNLLAIVSQLSTFYCHDQPHLNSFYDTICRDMKAVYDSCTSIVEHGAFQANNIDIVKQSKALLGHLKKVALRKNNQRTAAQAIRNTIDAIESIEAYDSMIRKNYRANTTFMEQRTVILKTIAPSICNRVEEFAPLCRSNSFNGCQSIQNMIDICQQLQMEKDDNRINGLLQQMNETSNNILMIHKIEAMELDGGRINKKKNIKRTHKHKRIYSYTKRNKKQRK